MLTSGHVADCTAGEPLLEHLPDCEILHRYPAKRNPAGGQHATISGKHGVCGSGGCGDNVGGVRSSSGPNLLGGSWSFTPAVDGSLTNTYSDGTPVPALNFGRVAVGFYDTYSQTFATTPATKYTYSFIFDEDGGPSSGLLVTTTAASAIPQLSTWAMLFAGLASVSALAPGRSSASEQISEAAGSLAALFSRPLPCRKACLPGRVTLAHCCPNGL